MNFGRKILDKYGFKEGSGKNFEFMCYENKTKRFN